MALIDWGILGIYIISLVLMSIFIGRKQRDQRDYYLAGQRMKSWQVGFSLVANQVSAISLIGVPAFIALKKGGGLKWLQYELAVPLAMVVVIVFLVPIYWKNKGFSIYEFLEDRFGKSIRRTLSLIFLLGRSLAAGIILLSTSYVASACINLSLYATIIIIGIIALIYTSLGGIKADIYSDILQLIILWVSSLIVILVILNLLKGEGSLLALDTSRLKIFKMELFGASNNQTFSFWPMFLGGFFLYISYYGCDQSQAQRLLTTGNANQAKRSLMINSFIRFPLVLTYSLIGVLLLIFLKTNPRFFHLVSMKDPNYLMPEFFKSFIPPGLLGVIIAGIFAATMSSLDSAINSLSAATWEDFMVNLVPERIAKLTPKQKFLYARVISLLWGCLVILFAIYFSRSNETVVELVNKIGSAFYGPVAAVFLLGIINKGMKSFAVLIGFLGGVGLNLILWTVWSNSLSWMWWNVIGFGFTIGLAVGVNVLKGHTLGEWDLKWCGFKKDLKKVIYLIVFCVLITSVLIMIEAFLI